jgi:hypothetical protein
MKEKLIYVAGPFRGRNQFEIEKNIRKAEEAGLDVAILGGVPVIPHSMYRYYQNTLPDAVWTMSTMELFRRCDALLLIEGWRNSVGSVAEREEAIRLNVPIFDVSQDSDLRVIWYSLKTWISGVGSSLPVINE